MKTYPRRRRRVARHPRVAAFMPVPQRTRCDGWTPQRQAVFLAALSITRSVSAAARKVGMARETAYRLRRKPGAESFAAAWDLALGREPGKRKVTPEERAVRAIVGLLKPRIYRGECTAITRKVDDSALLAHLSHLDRVCADEDEFDRRSQSFTSGPACHAGPLRRRARAPISPVRRDGHAPDLRGKR